jgi:7-cyano-7-deazaguanine synthase
MCSINGFIKFSDKPVNDLNKKLESIIKCAEDRGRDSFGFAFIGYDNEVKQVRFTDRPSNVLGTTYNIPNLDLVKICLNNNRAEPTTEFVLNKRIEDVQPYISHDGNTIIVHNGTIANDKEISEKLKCKPDTKIDSAVISEYLSQSWDGKHLGVLRNYLMNTFIGSYALCIWDKRNPTKVHFATNYKPLYLNYSHEDEIMYFSSFPEYMDTDWGNPFNKNKMTEVKPYTCYTIDLETKETLYLPLYKSDYEVRQKRALIIASAGLDSTVCISWAKDKGYDISLLHFDYRCRAEANETKAINDIAKHFNAELITIPTDLFKNAIKNSRLTDEGSTISEGEAGSELAIEWVPARNLIFMSIAAGYAEAYGFDYIILGGNLEEAGAYADNEAIFQRKFGELLPNSLNLQKKVEVLTPVANLMKREIVDLGLKLNSPLDLTWSCYEAGEIHCGVCGPCKMRKTAFMMLGKPEVIKYADEKTMLGHTV